MSGIISDNLGRASGLIKAAAGGGKVLQAVIGTATATSDITATSFTATNLTCAITCASTSSRVLLLCSTNIQNYAGTAGLTFLRDSTNVSGVAYGICRQQITGQASPLSFSWLDSPSSTSEIDYYVAALQDSGNSCLITSGSTQKGIIMAIEIGG